MTTPERLPDERPSLTHSFTIGELHGFLCVGFYDDGRIGEVFAWAMQAGTTVHGLIDTTCIMISVALRHGTPLSKVVEKLKGQTYEPSGRTNHPAIPFATSFSDYAGRYLELLDGRVAVLNSGIVEPVWELVV